MKKIRSLTLIACVMALVASTANAQLRSKGIPGDWINDLLPENLPELTYRAYYKAFDKAKAQAFAGRYKLAAMTLATGEMGKTPQIDIALLKADIMANCGQREQAIAVLSEPKIVDTPRAQIARARILADLWRLDEAIAVIRQHLAKYPKSLHGNYYLGQFSEQAGDMTTAKEAYGWIQANYMADVMATGSRDFDSAEDYVLVGRGLDRWATLNKKYSEDRSLNAAILKIFTEAYDLLDVSYWPAHLAAAEFFLARDTDKEAREELGKALAANPNDARVIELTTAVLLSTWDFDGADKQIATLRAVDRNSPVADLLECRSLLQQRQPRDAMAPALCVLARQPKNIEALGLLAACYANQLDDARMKETLAEVEKLDPDNATAYLTVAGQLAAMRQYPRAEAMYKIAIERAGWWTSAFNGLGLLYTQSGHETEARLVLNQAAELDPYNYSTHNYLVLLDIMDAMGRSETEHFIIRYDIDEDPLIPMYFEDFLESIYDEICTTYGAKLKEKTMIEVFPKHDQFSVRTAGSPWIGTVGASTGRVIALCTPRMGEKTLGTYNWAQVLRHEYTHTVTLAATDNRITHWMTEGLAVTQEQVPLRWEWVSLLQSAVSNHQLFSMEDLTWAFIRPKRPTDRSQAYAQSYWVCTYITEKFGNDMILKMMADFGAGKNQRDVFPERLGKTLEEFDADFAAWAQDQVKDWGYDPETTKEYDAGVTAAEKLITDRKYPEAVAAWEKLTAMRPMERLPHDRLASLYDTDGTRDQAKALKHLIMLEGRAMKDSRYAKRIAAISLETGDIDQAVKYGIQAIHTDPYNFEGHELLAAAYAKAGDKPNAAREEGITNLLKDLRRRKLEAIERATTNPSAN